VNKDEYIISMAIRGWTNILASEEVTLELVKTQCLPILIY